MPILNRLTMTAAAAAIALAVPKPGLAETNMLFILDGSNSMWGQVEGVAKIKTAQDVLADLVADLPKDTKVGLMVYGHRSRESCDDIEILSSIGADGPAELVKKIRSVQPTGKTPIANALFGSLIAFSKFEGQNNHVVLISDGIETCGGDVCMAASVIANANIKPRVHVVGFDVGAKERAQLECIPKMGNGKYFSAANAGELKKAVTQVKQVAQAAPQPPQPKKKGPKEVFRDDFKGEELADHWEVLKPNPDAFIVEDGKLLIVSGTPGSMANETVENVFKLSEPLPKGDWTITAKFSTDFQTGLERAFIGIFDNRDNYLEVSLRAVIMPYRLDFFATFDVGAVRRRKGEDKTASLKLWSGGKFADHYTPGPFTNGIKDFPQPVLLRLQKKGRSYIGSAKLEGAKKPTWVTLDKFTILRQKGKVAVGMYQTKKGKGEGTIQVDWVKIETPQ